MTIYPVYIRMGADMRRAAEMISISEVSDLIRIGPYQFSWSYLEQGMDATVLFTSTAEIRSALRFQQPTLVPQEMTAASKVMEAAEAYNREQGHENDGFLSSEYGFLPVEPPFMDFFRRVLT